MGLGSQSLHWRTRTCKGGGGLPPLLAVSPGIVVIATGETWVSLKIARGIPTFLPTSLCGVLVFLFCILFGTVRSFSSSSLSHATLSHTHTHNFATHNYFTHNSFRRNSFTHDTTLSHRHTTLSHTQLFHTQLCHTHTHTHRHTHTHTTLSHTHTHIRTTLSHTGMVTSTFLLSGRRGAYGAGLW